MDQNNTNSECEQKIQDFERTLQIKVQLGWHGIPYKVSSGLVFSYIFSFFGYNPEVACVVQNLSKPMRSLYVRTMGFVGWVKSYPDVGAIVHSKFLYLNMVTWIPPRECSDFIYTYRNLLGGTAQAEFDAGIKCMKYLIRQHPRIYMVVLEQGQMWEQHKRFIDRCRSFYDTPQKFSVFVQCPWSNEVELLRVVNIGRTVNFGATVLLHEGIHMKYSGATIAGKAYGFGIAVGTNSGGKVTIEGTFCNNQPKGVCIVFTKGFVEIAEWRPTSKGSIRFGKATRYLKCTGGYLEVRFCDNMFFSNGGQMIECRRVDKEKAFFDEAGAYMDKNCFV